MFKQKITYLIIISVLPLLFSYGQTKTKVLKPKDNAERITIVISGKSRTYYNLVSGTPSIINVRGPGKLRIITRVQFSQNLSEKPKYSVLYKIDGSNKNTSEFDNIKPASNAIYKTGYPGKPGTGEDIVIHLGRGEHTVEFWNGSQKLKIAARYLFTKEKEKKYDWIALAPLYPNEPVDLVTREDVAHYYRFSKNKPLKVKLFGPTILRVLTRLENHFQMKGKINYRIQIKQDGKIQNTYMLSSERSDITSYKKPGSLVPGKAREIIAEVPPGKHIIEITPLDEDKNTILGKLLFPRKDVKLKE